MTTNILIVGNGFDLSHYLPTKYDHLMVAMQAIENWDIGKGEISFDDLFGALYEKENYFFSYTKAIYKTDEIKISVEQAKQIKEQLKDNVWYQYFSEHVKEVKTWIDFETKIQEALEIICEYMSNIEIYLKNNDSLDRVFTYFKSAKSEYYLSQKNIRILELLKILTVTYQRNVMAAGGRIQRQAVEYDSQWDDSKESISKSFIQKMKGFDRFLYTNLTNFLHKSLLNFGLLFNNYLKLITSMQVKKEFVEIEKLKNIHKIYSFNYTSTYSTNYDLEVKSYFLHGKISESNKLVLGVSDLEESLLHKYNLWGFTKYHQKLFLDTDYQFIEEFIVKKDNLLSEIEFTKEYWLSRAGSVTFFKQKIDKICEKDCLDLNFFIWGHSLDISDEVYIKELFSFNEPYDCTVRITIFYFDDNAKFDLLANLIHILKKEKVEKWMKKGWLKFEENPNITELNNIQPVELPKLN